MRHITTGETCNRCGEDLGEVSEYCLAMVCPHCHKPTGVCANCAWWFDDVKCEHCIYKMMPNGENDKGE